MTRLRFVALACVVASCAEDPAPPVYQTALVVTRDIVLSARADGLIEPIQTVEVKSKASGEIVEVAADVGDLVSRGQLLVRVDQRVPRNSLIQAEADSAAAQARLVNAERELERSDRLFESSSITEEQFENANLERANAYAALVRGRRTVEDARIAFEDTEVRAAGRGVILSRGIEVGTVIASASNAVSGGAVLMTMANLDTVQVRALVHELDIGKVQPDMDVTIAVDAYANRVFPARVLKVEPESVDDQGRTMFPVLVRIPNPDALLKPGMNTKVEIHIGAREQVAAVPNAALRGRRDLASAAPVLGTDTETLNAQLDESARIARGDTAPPSDGSAANENTFEFRGQTIQLPDGVTRAQVDAVMARMRNGGFQSMSAEDRALLQTLGRAAGGGRRGARESGSRGNQFQFGGDYIVFAMSNGIITPLEIRTGLTDLEYSEVVSGLTPGDTILLLPSTSLLQSQEQLQARIRRFTGRGIPGVGSGRR